MSLCDVIQELYPGDGTKIDFPFTFEYIDQADVEVSLFDSTTKKFIKQPLWVPGSASSGYIYHTPTTIRFVQVDGVTGDPPPNPPAGSPKNDLDQESNVRIRRRTDVSKPKAVFNPSSSIKAQDLNDNFDQLTNWAEETPCLVEEAISNIVIDVDQIDPDDVITEQEVNSGLSESEWNDNRLITAAAANRILSTDYSATTPLGTHYPGKLWYEDGSTKFLRVWNGSSWEVITSTAGGTPFEPAEIIYVNTQGTDSNNGKSQQTAVRTIKRALQLANANTVKPAVDVSTATYNKATGIVTITTASAHGILQGNSVKVSPITWTCTSPAGEKNYPASATEYTVQSKISNTQFTIYVGTSSKDHTYKAGQTPTPTVDPQDTRFGDGKIIAVAAGVYAEELPLQVQAKNLTIRGDSLRNTYVHPKITSAEEASYDPNVPADGSNELKHMFELNSGSYLTGMTFAGLKAKGTRGAVGLY